MIVVEGPDGAGKTHLVQSIRQHFPDLPLAPKAMSSDISPNVNMKTYIEAWVGPARPSYALFDRFALISGPLYAPILDDKYQLNIYSNIDWMVQQHSRFYGSVRPLVIYCLPPVSVVRDNVRNDSDNAKAAPYIERIYAAYVNRAAMDAGYTHNLRYDYTEGHTVDKPTPLARVLARIEATLDNWKKGYVR